MVYFTVCKIFTRLIRDENYSRDKFIATFFNNIVINHILDIAKKKKKKETHCSFNIIQKKKTSQRTLKKKKWSIYLGCLFAVTFTTITIDSGRPNSEIRRDTGGCGERHQWPNPVSVLTSFSWNKSAPSTAVFTRRVFFCFFVLSVWRRYLVVLWFFSFWRELRRPEFGACVFCLYPSRQYVHKAPLVFLETNASETWTREREREREREKCEV